MRTEISSEDAKKLQDQVNTILVRAYRDRRAHTYQKEAINWADLKCTDIIVCRSLIDDISYVVFTIEEASNAATGLQKFVVDELEKAGFKEAYGMQPVVETEW